MPFNESQPQPEGKDKQQRTITLVATLDGLPDPKVEKELSEFWPGVTIEWVNFRSIPDEPPENVKSLVLNCGDCPNTEVYNQKGVSVMRLLWNRDGSWAGFSEKP